MKNIIKLFLKRLAAILYDSLLIFALLMTFGSFWYMLLGEASLQGLPYQLYLLSIIALFYLLFWLKAGQTLGLKAWNLKVVGLQNEALTFHNASLRFILMALLFPLWPLNLLYFFLSGDHQMLHDRFSKTKVLDLSR